MYSYILTEISKLTVSARVNSVVLLASMFQTYFFLLLTQFCVHSLSWQHMATHTQIPELLQYIQSEKHNYTIKLAMLEGAI